MINSYKFHKLHNRVYFNITKYCEATILLGSLSQTPTHVREVSRYCSIYLSGLNMVEQCNLYIKCSN